MKALLSNGHLYPCRLNVALTTEQALRIAEAARLSGLKSGVYARHVLAGQPMPQPPVARIDMEAMCILQRIGADLRAVAAQSRAVNLSHHEQAAVRQAILDSALLLRQILGLPPVSRLELELMYPKPIAVEYIPAPPHASGAAIERTGDDR